MARAASLMAPEANGADSALVAMSNPLMITAFEKRKRVQDMSILLFVFENCKKVAASQFRKKAKVSLGAGLVYYAQCQQQASRQAGSQTSACSSGCMCCLGMTVHGIGQVQCGLPGLSANYA
jgi:hypothetical protein